MVSTRYEEKPSLSFWNMAFFMCYYKFRPDNVKALIYSLINYLEKKPISNYVKFESHRVRLH